MYARAHRARTLQLGLFLLVKSAMAIANLSYAPKCGSKLGGLANRLWASGAQASPVPKGRLPRNEVPKVQGRIQDAGNGQSHAMLSSDLGISLPPRALGTLLLF